ncbi:MAG: TIGR02996 domain-containing protein [Kofleriaceae bacterium]
MTAAASLDQLCDALGRDDLPAALGHALASWSEARGDALAEIVLELYARLPTRVPFAGANHLKRWHAAEALGDPQDIPRQVDYLRIDERLKVATLGITALARRPANPMLAHQLAALLAPMPYRAPVAAELYHQAIVMIARAATPSEVTALRTLAEALPTLGNAKLRDQIAGWIEQAIAQIAAHPQPVIELAAARTALADHATRSAGHAARTEQLLAAVYAHLSDDGPRLVLADHLAELGDPRGELIALQCQGSLSPKQQARVTKLLDTHYREWLAELGDTTVLKDGLAFERGFLARARVRLWSNRPRSVGHRIWSTLHTADIFEGSTITELLDPVCVSLRTLYGIDGNALDLIEETRRVLPIETIGLDYGGDDRIAGLADLAALLPALRELYVPSPRTSTLVRELLGHLSLDRLRMSAVPDKTWRELLGPHLRELVLHSASFRFTCDRDHPTVLRFELFGHGWEHLAPVHFDVDGLDKILFSAEPTTCEACTRRLLDLDQLARKFGVAVERVSP